LISFTFITEKKYVLVTGSGNDADTMEVIDKEGKNTVCSSAKYPKKWEHATGGVIDEKLLICGGEPRRLQYPYPKECYIMGKDMTWSKHADMKAARWRASSTVIQDYLWVTGGIGENRIRLATTEKIYLNGTVEPGINLPDAVSDHCMVEHHNSVYLLGGFDGRDYRRDVLQFLPEMGFTHSVAQPMIRAKSVFACGIFNSKLHSNRPIMVSAGSYYSAGKKTGEFWDFTNPDATWQPTGDVPVDLYYGAQMTTTQNGDSVLLTYGKDIFKLYCTNTTSCLWKKESNSLQIYRQWHLIFTVPSTLLENCNN